MKVRGMDEQMKPNNLFNGIPSDLPEELFATLHQARGLRIERIVSQSHASPSGFWYDQDENEWVIVLQGIVMAPLLYRFLHKFHLEVSEEGDDKANQRPSG
jgi:hypothetical protein